MLKFFLSHLETSHHIFAPFFSSPNVILYIFCYYFSPSLKNPNVGYNISCKNSLNFFPIFIILFIFYFLFYFLFFLLIPPSQTWKGGKTKMYYIDPYNKNRGSRLTHLERVCATGAGPNAQLGRNVLPGLLVRALKQQQRVRGQF